MKGIFLVSSVLILLFVRSASAQNRQLVQEDANSERRVALVIGNGVYETAALKNPVNDAQDMARVLRELRFDVIYKENLNQNDMKRAVRAFGEKLRGGGVALFYYAGHGVQVRGVNYLVPVNAKVENEEEVEYECVDAGFVLAQMESARNRMNIVILDACRNNPFARTFRSASRGLAQMDAPSGTLIAYATTPGSVASDGNARNGLYTQELLKHIRTPGLSVEEAFKRVRISVRNLTQGKQTPWESSSLIGDFYFIGAKAATASDRVPAANPSSSPTNIELSYWETIRNSTNSNDFKAYLREFPNGRFVTLAKNRISMLETSASKAAPASESSSENKYEFDALVIQINYRDKAGVSRLEDATKIAARLRSLGAVVKVQPLNYKDFGNMVMYGRRGSAKIAAQIARSINDIIEVFPQEIRWRDFTWHFKEDVYYISLQIK
jgi:hypothetical protein